jgi:hypothetical protein
VQQGLLLFLFSKEEAMLAVKPAGTPPETQSLDPQPATADLAERCLHLGAQVAALDQHLRQGHPATVEVKGLTAERRKLLLRLAAVALEEDVALSALESFCRHDGLGRFPQLLDREGLWGCWWSSPNARPPTWCATKPARSVAAAW